MKQRTGFLGIPLEPQILVSCQGPVPGEEGHVSPGHLCCTQLTDVDCTELGPVPPLMSKWASFSQELGTSSHSLCCISGQLLEKA